MDVAENSSDDRSCTRAPSLVSSKNDAKYSYFDCKATLCFLST